MPVRLACIGVLCLGAAGCASVMVQRPMPRVPEQGVTTSDRRGSEQAASTFSFQDELEIYKTVIRGFYHPAGRQVRWIDPRPLANGRSRAADSAAIAEPTVATAIVGAVGLSSVCVLGEVGGSCAGHEGGALRFSAPFADGQDAATLFVRYTPMRGAAVGIDGLASEIEFHLARTGRGWEMVGRRNVNAAGEARAP